MPTKLPRSRISSMPTLTDMELEMDKMFLSMTLKRPESRHRAELEMSLGNQVLVERLLDPRYPESVNKLRLPGGKVELGETPRQTLVREMQEEYGIELQTKYLVSLSFAEGPRGFMFRYRYEGNLPDNLVGKVSVEGHETLEPAKASPYYWF